MDLEQQMESIYRETPLDQIPWNIEDPPALLANLVHEKTILPCSAVDLGCGAGNYATWLALQGFRVTGIDLSARAVDLAAERARRLGADCTFRAADLRQGPGDLAGAFDFAFDWEVLHHVFPEDRPAYLRSVQRMLRPGGKYLSVCFSEKDPAFDSTAKYRTTPLGTVLYFTSESEARALFLKWFRIIELGTVETEGKYGVHRSIAALLERE